MDEIVDLSYPSQRLLCIGEEVNATSDQIQLAHFAAFDDWQKQDAILSNAIAENETCQQAGLGKMEKHRTGDSHQCTLCGKIFGNSNALSKHLLTHQADRPHVCPTCQRAFKRSDHLAGHMLTHQARKLHQCVEPGCQRKYCDAYSLKRHCLSQHSATHVMSESAPTHLHVPTLLDPGGDDVSKANSCGPISYPKVIVPSPMKTSGSSSVGSSYHSYANYNSFAGFSTMGRGLGVSQFKAEPTTSQERQLTGQDGWIPSSAKGMFASMGKNENLPSQDAQGSSQWPVGTEQEPDSIGVVDSSMTQSFAPESLGDNGWEKVLEFPVMDLQVLDSMLFCQPSNTNASVTHNVSGCQVEEKLACGDNCDLIKPSQQTPVNPGLTQVKMAQPKSDILPPWSISGPDFAPNLLPAAPLSQQSVLGAEVSILPKKEKSKKRSLKRTIAAEENLPQPVGSEKSVPRRPRPRPDFLISPSQVAMASFSSGKVSSSLKGTGLSATAQTDNGQQSAKRMDNIDLTEDRHSWEPPVSTDYNRMECHTVPSVSSLQLGQAAETPAVEAPASQRSPPCSERKCLSPLIIPVSVPVSKGPAQDTSSGGMRQNIPPFVGGVAHSAAGARAKKPRRHNSLKAILIPAAREFSPPEQESVGPRVRVTGGYFSQLRSPIYLAGQLLNPELQAAPYTPPPMLSPLRPGSGLYFSRLPQQHPCPPLAASFTAAMERKDGLSLVLDDSVVSMEPRINVGARFQAEIPPLRNQLLMLYEEHPAQLVWCPWGDIATNPDTQDRVTEFLNMCSSSVLPGGGANTELALHCLHEVQGDVLAALDLLLVRGDYRSSSHPLSDYHYTGSDIWKPQEKDFFRKVVISENKDFQLIHSMMPSKTVFQCVEYYYAMKKIKKFKQRSHADRRNGGGGLDSTVSPPDTDEQQVREKVAQHFLTRPKPASQQPPPVKDGVEYTCKECGRGFEKIRSRSAHMKTHRHQERNFPVVSSWFSPGRHMDNQHGQPPMESLVLSESDSP